MEKTYVPTTHKFVAVLNKKIPVNILMNALAHMSAGLVGSYPEITKMRFDTYTDKDGNAHKSISDNPYIILRADNSNKIRTLRYELVTQNIHFVDFISTMTVGTYAEQQHRTQETSEAELEYYGICLFGEINTLNTLTRKFSLWQ
ncbi:MAG: DUF2000 domain-containing protein [Candidatus Roizmanbacteria bacterium]|nr:DUF2000 domain-containing protein [Candidatus Roizmanbacteria bacterium]